jgi:altronate dehydratase small subunit
MIAKAYRVNERDNVAMLLTDVEPGEIVLIVSKNRGNRHESLPSVSKISAGHKIALVDFPQGTKVIKYGYVIGAADFAIKAGEHVHIHNMSGLRGRGDKR